MNCKTCLTRFDSGAFLPRILPACGHSLCQRCITELSQDSSVACPTCSTVSQGESFPVNRALASLTESRALCESHNKPIEAFCSKDQVLLCVQCILAGHQTHLLVAVDKAVQQERDSLKSLQGQLETARAGLTERSACIAEAMQFTENCYSRASADLEQFYKSVQRKLDARQAEVVSELNRVMKQETARLQKLQEDVRQQLEQLNSIEEEPPADGVQLLKTKSRRDALFAKVNTSASRPKKIDAFTRFTREKESLALTRLVRETATNQSIAVQSWRQKKDSANLVKTQMLKHKSSQSIQVARPVSLEHSVDLESLCGLPTQTVYLIGGFSEGPSLPMDVYELTHSRWDSVQVATLPRIQHAGLSFKEDILVLGGKVDGVATDSSEIISRVTGHSLPGPFKLPGPLSGFGSVVCPNSIVVAGGAERSPTNTVHQHTAKGWVKLPPMLACRDELSLVFGTDHCLYACGGHGGIDACALASAERLDLRVKKWQALEPMKAARRALAAVVMPDGIYALGGYNGRDYLSVVEKYEPRMNQWMSLASLNKARCTHSVAVDCQTIYAFGGFNNVGLASVEAYSVLENQWVDCSSMPRPRCMHTSTVFLDK